MYFEPIGAALRQDPEFPAEPIRVLVADDHPVHQAMHRALLENLGCTVQVAADGYEAVRMANAEAFDLIIMDRHMPGCSGDEATLLIRAFRDFAARVAIVCCSTDPPSGSEAAIYDQVLAKPLTAMAIITVLQACADRGLELAES